MANDTSGLKRNWVKGGKSPNPGGQTKAEAKARRMAADLVRDLTDGGAEIITFAVNVMRGGPIDEVAAGSQVPDDAGRWDPKSRRWAADFLANRLWGKASLVVEVTDGSEAAPLPDMRGIPVAELRRLALGEEPEAVDGGSAPVDDDLPSNVH